MESEVIISSIEEIYARFSIMPCLQAHMKTVAGVAEFIFEANARANKKDVIAALLLHDLGNIVKFKLDGEAPYWKKIQQETIAKYGQDDHEATKKMVNALGVNDRVAFLITEMGFENLPKIVDSNDVELKICFYSDLRVAPHGIVTIPERFADLRKRYKGTPLEGRYDAVHEEKALFLENQLFDRSYCSILRCRV